MGAILPFPSLHDYMEQVGLFNRTPTANNSSALGVLMHLRITAFSFYCEVTSQSEHGFSISVTSLKEPKLGITVVLAIRLEHVWKSCVVYYILPAINKIWCASLSFCTR